MFAHLAACFDYSTINMTLLDKILNAPDNARISILYPCTEGRGGETIGDAKELKDAIQTQIYDEGVRQIVQQGNAEISTWSK